MLGFYALGEAPSGAASDEINIAPFTKKRGYIYGRIPRGGWRYGRTK